MEWKKNKQLANKYWKAETTEEEQTLKKNITSSDDPHMDPQEVEYFKVLDSFSSASLDDDFDQRLFGRIASETSNKQFFRRQWFQMAASVLIAIGVTGGIGFHSYKEKRQREAREAFEITKSALFMVSERLNRGTQYTVDGLIKIEETQEKIKTQNYNN